MQEHHREKLARFRKDEGDVVDMRQRSISKWRGERGSDRHKDKGEEDRSRGENSRYRFRSRVGKEQVAIARDRCESRLDGIKEDGICKAGR